uniref:Peptidase A1 domain-containing protein n=1 Tax=Alexandrium monilatum TaxID=311494 RepID=A0A7S4RMF9_9DINO
MVHLLAVWLPLLLRLAQANPVVVPLTRRPGLVPKEQRRLSQTDEARLFGNLHALGSYHVDMLVGTPGQMQSVIVDTGSTMTAFPCTECGTKCGTHIDPPFDPQRSSTFRWVQCSESNCRQCSADGSTCGYSVRYVEGSSISGKFFEDVLHLGHAVRANSRHSVWLGCHTEETNLFLRQDPSGIMGLGDADWDVLTALMGGPLERRVVALCLSNDGGAMAFGGYNESWTPLEAPLQSVPYGLHYSVSVTGAALRTPGGQSVELATLAGRYAMDSGTTFTYFSNSQALALRSAVASACGAGACGSATRASSSCWRATEADLDRFPQLHIAMGQATYIWQARGYLSSEHPGLWCYTFRGDPPLTLGASFMRHHLVVFDRDAGMLHFAPSPCPSVASRNDSVPLHLAQRTWTAATTIGPSPAPITTTAEVASVSASRGQPLAVSLALASLVACMPLC